MDATLATAKFFITDGKHKYDVTLELVPSGGFSYGNKHALVLDFHDGSMERLFDARYDKRFNTVDSFNKYAMEFVKDQIRDTFTVERVD